MHTLKITISILLLLIIIIGLGLFSFSFLESSSKVIENQLVEVENNTYSGDWVKAGAWINSVKSNWASTSRIWTALIDHAEIDNIDTALAKMEKFILVKDSSMTLSEIATLKLLIKHIPDKEAFNLKNIL
jgi:hypothetical protein